MQNSHYFERNNEKGATPSITKLELAYALIDAVDEQMIECPFCESATLIKKVIDSITGTVLSVGEGVLIHEMKCPVWKAHSLVHKHERSNAA